MVEVRSKAGTQCWLLQQHSRVKCHTSRWNKTLGCAFVSGFSSSGHVDESVQLHRAARQYCLLMWGHAIACDVDQTTTAGKAKGGRVGVTLSKKQPPAQQIGWKGGCDIEQNNRWNSKGRKSGCDVEQNVGGPENGGGRRKSGSAMLLACRPPMDE